MFDIEQFVYRHFDVVDTYGNPPTDYRVECPFCDDIKGHMHISMDKHVVHCFRCGYARSWISFVMDTLKCSYIIALGELYKTPAMVDFQRKINTYIEETQPERSNVVLPADFISLNGVLNGDYTAHKSYLINRKFTPEYWSMYNLGVADSVPYRIIIPIEFNYWQGRAIYKWMEPKYVNPSNSSSIAIFNSKALDLYDEVVVCEGAFSAMAVGDNAIALIGKESPKEKLDRIVHSSVSKFIIALEPDAFNTMMKLTDALVGMGKEVMIWKYDFGDPAEVGATFQELPYNLKTKIMFMIE